VKSAGQRLAVGEEVNVTPSPRSDTDPPAPTRPRTSRQEPRRLRTLAALLDAGADLLAERSIDAIPVNDIVDAAHVAKGSFFNHFASKEDFADQIASRIRGGIEARIDAVNQGVADPGLRLARGFVSFMAFALEQPRDARIMIRAQPLGSEPSHPMNAGLRADLMAGYASGVFVYPRLETAVLLVIGAGQTTLATCLRQEVNPAEAKALTGHMLEFVLIGLTRDPARSAAVTAAAMTLMDDHVLREP
jgi:AcrR family transcriptional regulator